MDDIDSSILAAMKRKKSPKTAENEPICDKVKNNDSVEPSDSCNHSSVLNIQTQKDKLCEIENFSLPNVLNCSDNGADFDSNKSIQNIQTQKSSDCEIENFSLLNILTNKKYEKSIWPHDIPHCFEPRPDLSEDTKPWQALLHNALQLDDEAREVYGLLHGIRCLGGKLDVEKKGRDRKLKLSRGEISEGEWGRIKADWLGKYVEGIRGIFTVTEDLGRVETKVSPGAPWWVQARVADYSKGFSMVGPGTEAELQRDAQKPLPKAKQESLFGEGLTIERL